MNANKVYIETLGCPKNLWDSQQGVNCLKAAGYELTEDLEEARIVIINTCGFINAAKEESIDSILELAELKNEKAVLLVSGCLSERYREELFNEMPEIDIMTGINDYGRLPGLIEKFNRQGRFYTFSEAGESSEGNAEKGTGKIIDKNHEFSPVYAHTKASAYLKIAEGCDSFCSYCVIPFIRGRYKSRPMEDILKDAEEMPRHGVKELILIAQDLCYYGMDLYKERSLAKLLNKLCLIEDIKWIRLMYCYEDGITDELIEVMAENPKICPYIDIPIQHSEDKILKEMNRNSTGKSILCTVNMLRLRIPDIHIRTTLLSGFPGETEADAKALEDFIKKMKFERLGVFAFSKEEGTPAYDMAEQVPTEEAEKRRDRLMEIQKEISLKINEAKVGSILEVLVEEKEGNVYLGRSCYDAPEIDNMVVFTSSHGPKPGQFVWVEIEEALEYDLFGREIRRMQ